MSPKVAFSILGCVVASVFLLRNADSTGQEFRLNPGLGYAPDEVLVRFRSEIEESDRTTARASLSAQVLHGFRTGAEQWHIGNGLTVAEAVENLLSNPHVSYAEPNYITRLSAIDPNDPKYPGQWALKNTGQTISSLSCSSGADLDMRDAWTISSGSSSVVAAVIDSEMNLDHEDIAPNLWVNPLEVAGDPNNIDEDGCGYINDVHGYDFNDQDPDPNSDRISSHATRVASVIGARGNNNLGVAGVNWIVSLMALKATRPIPSGSSFVSEAVAAIEYATCWNVDVINASWDIGGASSQTLEDAIKEAGDHEIVFVTSAGNDGLDLDGDPNDAIYPPGYDLDNIVTVAATDCTDGVADFSNYGAVSVDIAAPGVDTYNAAGMSGSTSTYTPFSGTSAAAPHVAGVIALIRALSPNIPVELIKRHLLDPNSLELLADLDPNSGGHPVSSGGRLDAYKILLSHDPNSPAQITTLSASASGNTSLALSWNSTGDDGSTGAATLYQVRSSMSPIDSTNWLSATRAGSEPTPYGSSGHAESMTLGNLAKGKRYYVGLKAFDEWGNGPLSNTVSCRTTGGVCVVSFCRASGEVFERCDFNDTYGTCGCCTYTCAVDANCAEADSCPPEACLAACS